MQIKTAKAAILARSHELLIVDDIEFPDALGVGQVLVKVLYTTICGAQINEIAAVKGPDKFLPHLLGHEATAEVIEVGLGVRTVKPGDIVVLHWRPSLGIQGKPASYRWRGATLNAGWVTTFSEYAVVSENRMTPIPPDTDLKIAALFGCAITTAMGVVANDAKIKLGESVVVFGVGGVGLPIVQFAAMAGAYPIVAVEFWSDKRERAKACGATHTFVRPIAWDSRSAILDVVGQKGADKIVDTTGNKTVIECAYDLTAPEGTCVLVGVPSEKVTIDTLPLHFNKTLTGSHGGGSRPHIDIPRILKLMNAGKISFDGMITHEFPLERINEAIDVMRGGAAGRVLIDI